MIRQQRFSYEDDVLREKDGVSDSNAAEVPNE